MRYSPLIVIALLFAVNSAAQTAMDSLAWNQAVWNTTELGRGASVSYTQMRIFGCVESISVLKYPAGRFRTFVVHSPEDEAGTTDSLAKSKRARFAINGSYFDMEKIVPHTYFSLNHRLISSSPEKEEYRSTGVLLQKRKYSRRFELCSYSSVYTDSLSKNHYLALASGPLLIKDGCKQHLDVERSFYTNRHPRSMIGWDNEGNIFMVVVDGRFPGLADGATIMEMYVIARLLGMTNAINLDGGGSSTLWTDITGVVNHPYDNHTFDHGGCRRVPNIIAVK